MHGGDVYTNGIFMEKELLDYSSNINPLGVPKSFENNINKALDALIRYPDLQYRELKKSLEDYTGVNSEYFVLGNGAAEIIDITISRLESILIMAPCFGEYEESAIKHNCKVEYSYLVEESIDNNIFSFNYAYEDIIKKLEKVQGLIIGNPNNPNGSIIDKDRFISILDYCENNKKTVIIDEAFIEFVADMGKSFINYIEKYKCLVIIRAITKFFAMPGIRFGYGICSDVNYIATLHKYQLPWNINSFAELAVNEVLKDEEYIEKSLRWILEESSFFYEKLRNVHLFEKVYKSSGNFILCKLKDITDEELYKLALEKDLLIRTCGSYRGLNSKYIRLAIKDRKNNLKVIDIFKNIVKEGDNS
ncbi:MAG: histidinol-phosphate transaminase [Clostridium sp.]